MKNIVPIILILLLTISFSYTYDLKVASLSSLGAICGAYVGQNVSVPILIILNKFSIVKGDIFSPFSTAMYDAMDNGAMFGSVVGAIATKYICLGKYDIGEMLFDTTVSLMIYSISKELFSHFDAMTNTVFLSPIANGIALGGVW